MLNILDGIEKVERSTKQQYKFSLLIPTWNNLAFLKNCINSILRNSHFEMQLIVIVNEGNDGTIEWLESQNGIDYILSKDNIGICYALNMARSMVKSEYIVYVNDDMYMLPQWDVEIDKEIMAIGHKNFMLSSTMIEPRSSRNPCVIERDYGDDLHSFNEGRLLNEYPRLYTDDWSGSTWPPSIVHIDMWDLVGGMSVEFSPGFYSDPDFSRKLFAAGVRLFKGKGRSLVYHFGSKSTNRVRMNSGREMFLHKWGITSSTFTKEYLSMGSPFSGEAAVPKKNAISNILNKLKRIKSSF